MNDLINYSGSLLATVLALVQFRKDWKSERKSWLKLVGFGLIILIGIGGIFNTYFNDAQRREDQQQIAELKATQEANKKQSEKFFSIMLQKVSDLQSEIRNEGLQKRADQLTAELKATQKAMNQPKAKLRFAFEDQNRRSDKPLRRVVLPVKNDQVHVKFMIINDSDVSALNGELTMRIPKSCEYASEPPNFTKLDGAEDTDRNLQFDRILADRALKGLSVDIKVPQEADSISIVLRPGCVNCQIDSWRADTGWIILSR